MDSSNAHLAAPRRTGRIVGSLLAVAALLLLFVILIGRWLSPSLLWATDSTQHCDDVSGYCIDHVTRGDLLVLGPYDEFHVSTKTNPDRFYSATNPFDPDADLTYGTAGEVTITDGTITLTWDKAILARLGD